MAMNAESQLHWCGYSDGAARVQPFMSFRYRILPARALNSSGWSKICLQERFRTWCSAFVIIVIYSTAGDWWCFISAFLVRLRAFADPFPDLVAGPS
jgi:hypothetical protein